jgi:hypothetical protein
VRRESGAQRPAVGPTRAQLLARPVGPDGRPLTPRMPVQGQAQNQPTHCRMPVTQGQPVQLPRPAPPSQRPKFPMELERFPQPQPHGRPRPDYPHPFFDPGRINQPGLQPDAPPDYIGQGLLQQRAARLVQERRNDANQLVQPDSVHEPNIPPDAAPVPSGYEVTSKVPEVLQSNKDLNAGGQAVDKVRSRGNAETTRKSHLSDRVERKEGGTESNAINLERAEEGLEWLASW